MKIINGIIGVLVAVVLFVACDKVDFPYLKEKPPVEVKDTVKTVLLEDFTGHKCPNCPTASLKVHDKKIEYGNRLIVVTMHDGFFASTSTGHFEYDFTTDAGSEYGKQFPSSNYPYFLVNRLKNGSSHVYSSGQFEEVVDSIIRTSPEKPEIYIEFENVNFNAADASVSFQTKASFMQDFPVGQYTMIVLITESEIIKPQKCNNPEIRDMYDEVEGDHILDYNHEHVLRGSVTPSWGDNLVDNSAVNNGEVITKTYSYELGDDWNPDHCSIVAYIYYGDGDRKYEVIQAAETTIK